MENKPGKIPLERPKRRWEDDIKVMSNKQDVRGAGFKCQTRVQSYVLVKV
jgi:hypothetical protein